MLNIIIGYYQSMCHQIKVHSRLCIAWKSIITKQTTTFTVVCTCCPHNLLIPVHVYLYKIWHCSHIWLNTEYAFPFILSVLIHSLLADSQITVSLMNYNTIHSTLLHLYEYIYCCSHITILLYYMPHHLLIQMYINNHTHTVCINVNIPWTWAMYARGKIRLFTLLLGCVCPRWRPNCVPVCAWN